MGGLRRLKLRLPRVQGFLPRISTVFQFCLPVLKGCLLAFRMLVGRLKLLVFSRLSRLDEGYSSNNSSGSKNQPK